MILPNKYVREELSIIGQAGLLLSIRRPGMTVSDLWAAVRDARDGLSYDGFVLTLDLLYALGAVEYEGGILVWGGSSEN